MYAVDRTLRGAQPGLLSTFGEWRDVVLRRRARSLALADVQRCAEGERVRVVARVQADAQIHGALHGTPGVFRRLSFTIDGAAWVHERGVDFRLVDASGQLLVLVGGGRLVAPHDELIEYPAHCFDGLAVDLGGRRSLPARELVIKDGAFVEVVGHKATIADPGGGSASYRELAQVVALRSSRELPLLISFHGPSALS